ncbi:MAG TPA: tRNA pseudouridine(55) synthase TruB [Thermoanaerobaculia bacterium]|jgi:tRNA pseudouridine55 synthase|nr:tRNA pseudouridine(55) synthase TruB [Thermoanaerobaculia bacterium]
MQPQQPKVDGLLLVDKKTGITSHDVVEKFRRRSKIKKVGHTGTLDPLATGLLVLCVGKATRLQAYLMGMEKTYEGIIQFGWATDSYDAVGVPAGEPAEVNVEHIDFVPLVTPFLGAIEQMPPQFSAKKVGGVRAYELARKGEVAALTPKSITVYEFEIVQVSGSTVRFRVRSSAGTYVRSLAHDLGTAAGVPAHLKELRRTAIGNFRIADALPYETLENAPIETLLATPWFQSLSDVELPLPKLRIDWSQQGKFMRGQSIIMTPSVAVKIGDLLALGNPEDRLVAIGEVVNVLREGGPVEVQPKVVLAG